MEKKTRKPRQPRDPAERKTHVWDPLGKFIRQYQRKITAAHREIDDLAQRGENKKVSTPNYVQEVVAPMARLIREKLPELNIVVSEKIERINAKEAYYKVQIGETTLGGFSYPGASASHIDFTVFAHDRPWGRVQRISKLPQILKVIRELARFLELIPNDGSDERDE
jgi:hypothetical protein